MRQTASVDRRRGKKSRGRGFSKGELKEAGVSLAQALHLKLPVDVRRRTIHRENVSQIKKQFKTRKSNVKKGSS